MYILTKLLTSATGTFYPVTDQIEIFMNPEKHLFIYQLFYKNNK